MAFNLDNPGCILKIILFGCNKTEQPFAYSQVSPAFFDCIEQFAASAIITKYNIQEIPCVNGKGFLAESKIKTIDMKPFWSVTKVSHLFLNGSRVTKLDFSGNIFENVQTIGAGFCANCERLYSVNITSFEKLIKIGPHFLSGATALTKLILPKRKMTKLKDIGTHFLQNLTSLRKIENHEEFFVACESIGDDFLADSESLESFDFSQFHSIKSIGERFLANSGVQGKLDFSAMMSYAKRGIPNEFLLKCSNVAQIVGLDVLFGGVTEIVGFGFLEGCTSLTELDVRFLRHVIRLEYRFLSGCTSLSKLTNFEKIANITGIGHSCFENCSSLKMINTAGFRNLRRLGSGFAIGCSQIEILDFSVCKMIDGREHSSSYGDPNAGKQNFSRTCNKSLTLILFPQNWVKHQIVMDNIIKAGQDKNGKATLGFDVVIVTD